MQMNRKHIVLILFALMLGVLTTISMADEPDEAFTTIQISDTYEDWSELASNGVDEAGNILFAYGETHIMYENRIKVRHYNPKTKTFGQMAEIPGQDLNNLWSRTVGGKAGEFYVTWCRNEDHHSPGHIMFSKYTNGKLSPAQVISQPDLESEFPVAHYDHKSHELTVAWTSWTSAENFDTFLRQYKDGKWGSIQQIVFTDTTEAHVEIAKDDKGVLYAVFMQKALVGGGEVFVVGYTNNRDGGKWLREPIFLTTDPNTMFLPNIAVNPDGTEILVQWYDKDSYTHRCRKISYNGGRETYGPIMDIDVGHDNHAYYFTGLQYHIDRFYFVYITNETICMRSFKDNRWSAREVMPNSSDAPKCLTFTASPYYGFVIAWYRNTPWPPGSDHYATESFASIKRLEGNIFNILPVKSFSQTSRTLNTQFFYENNAILNWQNDDGNIENGVNKAKQFLLYRAPWGQAFNYTTAYKTFVANAPAEGFEIIEAGKLFSFVDPIPRGTPVDNYHYSMVVVDEAGNKSQAKEASLSSALSYKTPNPNTLEEK